ncbi:hypothetical protein NFI96_008476 [Prochilodus magdalenae]|nr:hypothetical protein NFI96_008476 [Prochilodus magdalenae]
MEKKETSLLREGLASSLSLEYGVESDSESEEDRGIYYTTDMDLPSAKNKETTPSYEIACDGFDTQGNF